MFWNIVAYVGLFVAALMLAMDTAIKQSKELTEKSPTFVRGKLWGFLPLSLIVLAGFIWIVKAINYQFKSEQSETTKRSTVQAELSFAPTFTVVVPRPTPAPTPTITVDPLIKRLTGFFRGHTYFQAEILVKENLGKTITISGTIKQVYLNDNGTGSIVFARGFDDPAVFMYFSKSWNQRLAALKEGDRVSIKGKIFKIDDDDVALDNCEIVDFDESK